MDTDLPNYDPKERIEVFWKQVFELQGLAGEPKYQILPVVKQMLNQNAACQSMQEL